MTDLKPCPFCGGRAQGGGILVGCTQCTALTGGSVWNQRVTDLRIEQIRKLIKEQYFNDNRLILEIYKITNEKP